MAARRPVQRAPPGAAPSPLGTRPRFGGPLARAPRLAHAPFRGGVRVLVHRRRRHRPPHQAPRTRRGAPGRARRPVQTSPESHPTHRPRRPRLRRQTQTHRREGHRPRAPPRPPRPNLYPRVHRSSASARTTRDRPCDARAVRNGGGSVRRLGTWRGAHFAAPARDPTTGLPTAATSLEDAADASRRRYGVAADIRERAGSACQETSRARGPPDASGPASARCTFRRKEAPKYTDAASFHAAQRATARATGRWDASPAIRPASARPATATTRLVAGEGRGGGGLPTAAPGSATAVARAARRASARAGSHFGGRTTTVLSRPVTATARGKKTVAFPDTREGREDVAAEATSGGGVRGRNSNPRGRVRGAGARVDGGALGALAIVGEKSEPEAEDDGGTGDGEGERAHQTRTVVGRVRRGDAPEIL